MNLLYFSTERVVLIIFVIAFFFLGLNYVPKVSSFFSERLVEVVNVK